VSPAVFLEPGQRTGKFRLDEIEKPQHIRKRFTAAY
jgi:putative NADH-flavin reductase